MNRSRTCVRPPGSFHRLLKRQALKRAGKNVCIGRTHGIHAEPVTFGFKLLVWYEEIGRHIGRLENALRTISVGRISGSVGTYIHLDPRVRSWPSKNSGCRQVSNQVLQRDRHAEVSPTLALLATSIEKIAVEIRHLQRSEVLELKSPLPRAEGLSSMPHKKNPVRAERIAGLAFRVRANAGVGLENVVSGTSGTSPTPRPSGSSSRLVHPGRFPADRDGRHRRPLGRPAGPHEAEYRSDPRPDLQPDGLLALTTKGLVREAYAVVQRNSLQAWNENLDFRALIAARSRRRPASLWSGHRQLLLPEALHLGKIDYIFERVLGHES